jgi:putative heme-binding domain-containing protein
VVLPTRLTILVAWSIVSIPAARAQHGSIAVTNPYTSRLDAEEGAQMFRARCASCHGANGEGGGSGPSLVSGSFKRGGSDEALFQTITKGIPGTTMPSFDLGGQRIWQLVTHLRSLVIARGASMVKGDAAAGARLFEKLGCLSCHAVSGAGAFTGPELTSIGSARSPAELRGSLVNPSERVEAQYWRVSAKTKDGRSVSGTRMNEDTHSVQIRDASGRLTSLLKRDLERYDLVRESPMPSMAGKLSEAEMENLLAYLTGLRGGQ